MNKCCHEWRLKMKGYGKHYFYCIHCLSQALQNDVTCRYEIKYALESIKEVQENKDE